MGLADEVKLYESLWDEPKKVSKKPALTQAKKSAKRLTEGRSAAEIQAEIDALMVELKAAEDAEMRAISGVPTVLWSWDIYLDPSEKGTWTSLENEVVFETKEDAMNGAIEHLNELDEEGELDYNPDEYTIDVFEVPLSQVSADTLSFSNLDHLITQGVSNLKQASSPSGTPQFEITYCFGNGPVNVGYLYAVDENEARESFIDYLVDNGEIVYDDDVTILKIKRT